jgi:hypothetical protein
VRAIAATQGDVERAEQELGLGDIIAEGLKTRTKWWLTRGGLPLILVLAFLLLIGMIQSATQQVGKCSASGLIATGGTPTAAAASTIPGNWMPILQAAEQHYGVPWNVLAGIASVETDFGRSKLPGVHSGANYAGAEGDMQFEPSTWAKYGVDADGDGKKDPYNPADAVFGAANYLRASGAPGDMNKAIFAYNHDPAYVAEVLRRAKEFAAGDFTVSQSTAGGGSCYSLGGSGGDSDAEALAQNKNITFLHPGPELNDLRSGRVSPKEVALLSLIAESHKIGIFALASDHHPGTNHEAGRAADIATVDGEVCNALLHGRSGKCWELAQELDRIQGCMHPTELIYYYDPGPSPDSFARADHNDHVHVGYDGPLGPKHYKPGIDPCSPESISGTG